MRSRTAGDIRTVRPIRAGAHRSLPQRGQDRGGALSQLLTQGAKVSQPLQDVGDGILVAAVHDPFGNELGIIENPHFPNTQG
jgi:hypothetical protein